MNDFRHPLVRVVNVAPSPPPGSLLDFLKSEEGSKQPLPKLIDFSAQVRVRWGSQGRGQELNCLFNKYLLITDYNYS